MFSYWNNVNDIIAKSDQETKFILDKAKVDVEARLAYHSDNPKITAQLLEAIDDINDFESNVLHVEPTSDGQGVLTRRKRQATPVDCAALLIQISKLEATIAQAQTNITILEANLVKYNNLTTIYQNKANLATSSIKTTYQTLANTYKSLATSTATAITNAKLQLATNQQTLIQLQASYQANCVTARRL